MRVQHNITSMNTTRILAGNSGETAKNVEKLSSGFRINRAGDDAAGLAISEKMRAQIRGLTQASKNAQDGISLIQTAEGALQSSHDVLQRLRELAVQSASDTNETTIDRAALDKEFQALMAEIDDTADKTKFNDMTLLDGSLAKSTAATTVMAAPFAAVGADMPISPMAAGELTPPNNVVATFTSGSQTITQSGVYILGTGYVGTITVQAGLNVVFQQTDPNTELLGVAFNCVGANTNLFLDKLNIRNNDNSIVEIKGINSSLNLIGNNNLTKTAGNTALIRVEGGTELTINNASGESGTLNATIVGNNNLGAVIGGGGSNHAGSINIAGGAINLQINGDNNLGAVIGGSSYGNGGNISISGGVIDIKISGAGNTGAAIGGGGSMVAGAKAGNGANLTLFGGTLTIAGGLLGGGQNSANSANAGTGGSLYFSDVNDLYDINEYLVTAIVLRHTSGTQYHRLLVSLPDGGSFTPNETVNYTFDGNGYTVQTNNASELFLILPGDHTDKIDLVMNNKNYQGTIDIWSSNILALQMSPPPAISAGSATRISDDAATFTFTSDKDGYYYYVVLDSGDPTSVDADYIMNNSGGPGSCGTSQQTITFGGLSSGAKDVYVVAHDLNGYSNILKIALPAYDPSQPPPPPPPPPPPSPVQPLGGLVLQTGANMGDTMTVYIDAMNTKSLGLKDPPPGANVATRQGASAAIDAVAGAINKVSAQRAELGALQNRLEYKISNLDNSAENLQSAESRIRDLDMAKEMTDFTKNNILGQSATAMLAQANTLPQAVLQLLR